MLQAGADPAVEPMIATWRGRRFARRRRQSPPGCCWPWCSKRRACSAKAACGTARDVDLGVLLGLGFPRSRGGLLYWADTLGLRRPSAMLEPWAGLGERFRPTPMLKRMAAEDRRFGDRSGEF